ncbi:MAG: EAL domain-containing protein, partial [Lachnospiraceae bacterium]|nr:EAL domain-containing protein [Lachnospiraceae bacterium]
IGKSNEYTKSCAVVKQIIALAKDLNMRCLAEGAENKEQVDLLRDFGCEIVQGYYYSKPLPVEEYEKLL